MSTARNLVIGSGVTLLAVLVLVPLAPAIEPRLAAIIDAVQLAWYGP